MKSREVFLSFYLYLYLYLYLFLVNYKLKGAYNSGKEIYVATS